MTLTRSCIIIQIPAPHESACGSPTYESMTVYVHCTLPSFSDAFPKLKLNSPLKMNNTMCCSSSISNIPQTQMNRQPIPCWTVLSANCQHISCDSACLPRASPFCRRGCLPYPLPLFPIQSFTKLKRRENLIITTVLFSRIHPYTSLTFFIVTVFLNPLIEIGASGVMISYIKGSSEENEGDFSVKTNHIKQDSN